MTLQKASVQATSGHHQRNGIPAGAHLKGFPRIDKKGSHPRFPRDAVVEWMRENWREL